MIEIKNLTKRFGTTVATNDVTLTFDKGIIGLVGQNGAGKSTLLRLIAGVLYPDEGEILIDGKPNDLKQSKASVLFLNDDPYVPSPRINDLINLYDALYDFNKDIFYEIIKKFNLPINKKITSFSKGMTRQLFIAITLAIDAKYYLLDEAFDGLDPLSLQLIKQEILNLYNKDKTIIISSHNISALERLVDRFVIIYNGKISNDDINKKSNEQLIKYQIMIDNENFNEEYLNSNGFNVVSFTKVGSIYHVVFLSENSKNTMKALKNKFKDISLIEPIAMSSDEIVSLDMVLARKEGN